jgi:hypothetical protein
MTCRSLDRVIPPHPPRPSVVSSDSQTEASRRTPPTTTPRDVNQGLHGFCAALFARLHGLPIQSLTGFSEFPTYARWILAGLPWTLIAISTVATWRAQHRPEVCVALWTCTFLLGYKDVWEHTYSFALPALLLRLRSESVSARLVVVCAVGLALPTGFVAYDIPVPTGYDPAYLFDTATSLIHHATKPIWVLILFAALVGSRTPAERCAAASRRAQ